MVWMPHTSWELCTATLSLGDGFPAVQFVRRKSVESVTCQPQFTRAKEPTLLCNHLAGGDST